MIVHIGGGARAIGDDLPFFRTIIDTIQAKGCYVARNWIEITNHNVTVRAIEDQDVDWVDIADQNEEALRRADAYIADTTAYRLFNGYELAKALEQGKPVLLVSRKSFKQFAISGVQNDLLTMKEYSTEEELRQIVAEFLAKNTIPEDAKEVSVPLDLQLHSYISEQHTKKGTPKSDILNELAKRGLQDIK